MANKKITDLTELTTPASDDVLPIVDISETSNANKNKKIKVVNLIENLTDVDLKLANGTEAAPSLAFTSAASTGLYRSAANELSITTNGGRAIKVESNNKTTIYGDLVVTGGTTTISSTQIDVTDKNLQLATGNSSDSGADGGGLTLKGADDKTWNWVDSTDAWTANQHIDVATGKAYKIAGTQVVTATTLGSTVVNSSLTSVGTLGSLTVTNTVTANLFSGSGASLTANTIPYASLVNIAANRVLGRSNAGAVEATQVQTGMIADSSITSAKIENGTIVNVDINASAAIAGTKISPDFGSQNITTTGTINGRDLTLSDTTPKIQLTDSNADSDFSLELDGGLFQIRDTTNDAYRLKIASDGTVTIGQNLDALGGIDVTGAITSTGNLQVAGNPTGGTAQGVKTFASGYIELCNTNDSYTILKGFKQGSSSATSVITVAGNATFAATVTANTFSGSGASLTALNADNISSGTLARDRIENNAINADKIANSTVTFAKMQDVAQYVLLGRTSSGSGPIQAITAIPNGVTATTQSASDNSTKVATTAYTDTAISNLIDSSPGTLNTLNELAAALGDDANFSTTVTNSIATKAVLSGSTNNTICTVTGANAITGEGNLTFNGSGDLTVKGNDGISANLYLIADRGDDNGDGWRVGSNQDDNDLTFANNTSGSYVDKLTLLNNGNATFSGHVYLPDYKRIYFGNTTTPDFSIYHHAGGTTYLETTNTSGNLVIDNSVGVDLYINSGDDIFLRTGGTTQALKLDSSQNATFAASVYIPDNEIIGFGNPAVPDLRIYHESGGTNGMIFNKTGDLYIQGNDGSGAAQTAIQIHSNGAVDLKYAGAGPKFSTTATGAKVAGTLEVRAGNALELYNGFDNQKARIQNAAGSNYGNLEFKVVHNGTEATALSINPDSSATFAGDISLGDNDITNVGVISLDKIQPDGSNIVLNMATNKNISFSGGIGEIGSVTGFQAINDAADALTDFGIRGITIRFATGSAERLRVQDDKVMFSVDAKPNADNSLDLGASGARWQDVYGVNFHGSGASLTSLNASNLSSGTVATARLGSGTASSGVYLRGDGTWAAVSAGSASSLSGLAASQFLRSDTADTASGDITFSGGAGAVTVAAASDIRIAGGSWTGEYTGGLRIQANSSDSYIQYQGNLYFRATDADNTFSISQSGSATFDGQISAAGSTVWNAGNDGSGSGLDADKLDGSEATKFFSSYDRTTTTGWEDNNGNFRINSGSTVAGLAMHESDGTFAFQLYGDGTYYGFLNGNWASWDIKKQLNGNMTLNNNAANIVWHAGNDGAGSGLDADTVDGFATSQSGGGNYIAVMASNGYLYVNNWISVANSTGLFAPGGSHLFNGGASTWKAWINQSTHSTASGIGMNSSGTDRGWAYADSAHVGFLNAGGTWVFKCPVGNVDNPLTGSGYTLWHSNNDGSGSGLDADTLDGRDSSSSATANTIALRDSGSQLYVSYLNSTSGDRSSTKPTRYHASDDTFLRYYDGRYMRMWLGLSAKDGNYARRDYQSDSNYWVGAATNGTVPLNDCMGKGNVFWDTWSSPSGQPSGTTHWTGFNCLHYTNRGTDGTSSGGAYGWQMTMGAGSAGLLYVRGNWSSAALGTPTWYKVWNEANDGSGSGLDADKWDGYQFSDYLNQSVLTTSSPTFNNIYSNAWLRNNDNNEGLYNTANSNHFYSSSSAYFAFDGNGSYGGLQCRDNHGSTVRGYFYFNNSSNIGILNDAGSWIIQCNSSKSTLFHGSVYPSGSHDLGSSSSRWNNIYVNDLQLSNESKKDEGGNDVDGTWGNWTLQEGEKNIFMINNRSGKKYKIALQEV